MKLSETKVNYNTKQRARESKRGCVLRAVKYLHMPTLTIYIDETLVRDAQHKNENNGFV